jgi:hypothetical protein
MTRSCRSVSKLEGMSIIDAIFEPGLLGSAFVGDPESWRPWQAFWRALFGLPMGDGEVELYRACTARQAPPDAPFRTAYLVCGRGAGKSFIMSLTAVYLACFRNWTANLAPGGRPIVLLVAPTREQAKIDLIISSAF